jgi:hypothetical protein
MIMRFVPVIGVQGPAEYRKLVRRGTNRLGLVKRVPGSVQTHVSPVEVLELILNRQICGIVLIEHKKQYHQIVHHGWEQ